MMNNTCHDHDYDDEYWLMMCADNDCHDYNDNDADDNADALSDWEIKLRKLFSRF